MTGDRQVDGGLKTFWPDVDWVNSLPTLNRYRFLEPKKMRQSQADEKSNNRIAESSIKKGEERKSGHTGDNLPFVIVKWHALKSTDFEVFFSVLNKYHNRLEQKDESHEAASARMASNATSKKAASKVASQVVSETSDPQIIDRMNLAEWEEDLYEEVWESLHTSDSDQFFRGLTMMNKLLWAAHQLRPGTIGYPIREKTLTFLCTRFGINNRIRVLNACRQRGIVTKKELEEIAHDRNVAGVKNLSSPHHKYTHTVKSVDSA